VSGLSDILAASLRLGSQLIKRNPTVAQTYSFMPHVLSEHSLWSGCSEPLLLPRHIVQWKNRTLRDLSREDIYTLQTSKLL
jgi:hypothetical protein